MNFISRIIKSINAMRERLKIERHEAMYGPHFNEECALKAVSKMENEDGSRGEHWSLEETTSIANQYGINLKGEKYNKYDWYVALNMIRSDYYRAVVTMTSSDHIKYFVELAKAWLNDKDIEEGKMWYYYCYIMQVSNPYDEALPQGQFPIPGQNRRKLVDVFISCNGESKKLSVPAERSIINDTSIGLTVATNKEEIANMVRQNYNEFKAKKEAASKYDEEMEKCKDILDQLEAQVEIPTVTNTVDNSKEINDLKNDVADIRKMIEDTKKMFMGGFPKPPMPPMPNVPALMK